jgi:hypothetical protein
MFSRKPSEPESAMGDARMLGLFSYGLGIAQVVKPGAVNRFIGVPDHNPNHALQRLLGVREIVSGTGILFGNNTNVWMWSRVAGDAMDMMILTGTLSAGLGTRKRLIPAIAAVVGIAALDASVAIRAREH